MGVHLIHDLGEQELTVPYQPVVAVCRKELQRAHEIKRVESDEDMCPQCLSEKKPVPEFQSSFGYAGVKFVHELVKKAFVLR